MSALARFADFRHLKRRYGCTAFIETGCHEGDGLLFAKSLGFETLASCDLNETFVTRARFRVPDAEIIVGDSCAFLAAILPGRQERTAFWLDAHYPSVFGMDEPAELRWPLEAELALIKRLKTGLDRDVILCDDIRVIRDPDNPRYRLGEVSALEVTTSYRAITSLFVETHRHHLYLEQEGILAFLPVAGPTRAADESSEHGS